MGPGIAIELVAISMWSLNAISAKPHLIDLHGQLPQAMTALLADVLPTLRNFFLIDSFFVGFVCTPEASSREDWIHFFEHAGTMLIAGEPVTSSPPASAIGSLTSIVALAPLYRSRLVVLACN